MQKLCCFPRLTFAVCGSLLQRGDRPGALLLLWRPQRPAVAARDVSRAADRFGGAWQPLHRRCVGRPDRAAGETQFLRFSTSVTYNMSFSGSALPGSLLIEAASGGQTAQRLCCHPCSRHLRAQSSCNPMASCGTTVVVNLQT